MSLFVSHNNSEEQITKNLKSANRRAENDLLVCVWTQNMENNMWRRRAMKGTESLVVEVFNFNPRK